MGAVFLLVGLAACASPSAEDSVPAGLELEWRERELERFSGACDTADDPCGRFTAMFPQFTLAAAPDVAERLNEAVQTLLTGGGPVTLAGMANELIAGFRAARQEFPGAASTQRWEERRSVRVVHHDDRLVSLRFEVYSDTGGAHPDSQTTYASWSLADGERVLLEDLLLEGYEEPLAEIGEAAFRQARGLTVDRDLEELGFRFADGRFALPDNFAVTESGLVFHYNPYEIAPYSLGPTELTITWVEIGELARAE